MRKTSMILMFALLILSMGFASVKSVEGLPTAVNGHIYAPDGITPLTGVNVDVTCASLGPVTDATNSAGYYVVEFSEGCNIGDTVTVSAGGVTVTDQVANAVIWQNIVYANLTVPEFGILGALGALAGSVVLFTVIRKRNGRK